MAEEYDTQLTLTLWSSSCAPRPLISTQLGAPINPFLSCNYKKFGHWRRISNHFQQRQAYLYEGSDPDRIS
jgi:hypothetical protein